jgi:hypothetical protein
MSSRREVWRKPGEGRVSEMLGGGREWVDGAVLERLLEGRTEELQGSISDGSTHCEHVSQTVMIVTFSAVAYR